MMDQQLIVFTIAGEFYGIEVTRVREIQTYSTPTLLPNTQPFVKGVINIRGDIVPVIDLYLRFDPQANPLYTDTTLMVTTKTSNGRMVAVIVAAIDTLAEYSSSKTIEFSTEVMFINRRYIEKIIAIDNRHVMVIDIDALFCAEEIINF